jgi:hypothetical protein
VCDWLLGDQKNTKQKNMKCQRGVVDFLLLEKSRQTFKHKKQEPRRKENKRE